MFGRTIPCGLVFIFALTSCSSFDIVQQLENQQKQIASTGSCVATAPPVASPVAPPAAGNTPPAPGAAPAPVAAAAPAPAAAVSARLASVPNPNFTKHVLGGSPAEQVATAQQNQAATLGAPMSNEDRIVQTQLAFIQDPVGARDRYLQNLGPMGQSGLVRIAATVLLSARAHNLAKVGVVNPDDADKAVGKLLASSSTLSKDDLKEFAQNKAGQLLATTAAPAPAATAAPAPTAVAAPAAAPVGAPAAPSPAPAAAAPPATAPAAPTPTAFQQLIQYYNAYYGTNGFIMRDGTKLTHSTITGTTIPSQFITGNEQILLEFLADYFLGTPIFDQVTTSKSAAGQTTTTTTYFPMASSTVIPTAAATKFVDILPISTNEGCGMSAVKSKAANLLATEVADETVTLSSSFLESIGSVNIGVVVFGANISVGNATTLQDMAKMFIEEVTQRAVLALSTDVFIAANTGDLNWLLNTVVNAVSTAPPATPPAPAAAAAAAAPVAQTL